MPLNCDLRIYPSLRLVPTRGKGDRCTVYQIPPLKSLRVILLALSASRHRHFHLSHEPFISLFVPLHSDVICAFQHQHRWMRPLTKAVTLSQEGTLNYHIQGCALHERSTRKHKIYTPTNDCVRAWMRVVMHMSARLSHTPHSHSFMETCQWTL